MKFNDLGVSQILKSRNLTRRILGISLKLNLFTPNTLGCYGLRLTEPNLFVIDLH